jgi:hypothetical protein
MNIDQLKTYLDTLIKTLEAEDKERLMARMSELISRFPFNEYEYILMFLLNKKVIGFDDYEKLRDNYVSANKYRDLFDIAPRVFGGTWGETNVMKLDKRFIKASKKSDPAFSGDYDLRIDSVKVEVKACRAYDKNKSGSMAEKAIPHDSPAPFWMNFQQLKPDLCDTFIFIGLWTNQIVYWVLSADEVRNNPYVSHQHRGGVEYQIGITDRNIREFDKYQVEPSRLGTKTLKKGKRRK